MNKLSVKGCWHWFLGSIRRQLGMAFGCISLLVMLGFTGLLLKQQYDFLNEASVRRSFGLANGMAHSSVSWVLANDLVGLGEVLQSYVDTPNLDHALVISPRGEVLASTNLQEVGLFVDDPLSRQLLAKEESQPETLQADRQKIDVAVPIKVGERHLGWARIVVNQQATQDNLQRLLLTSLYFTLFTIGFVLAVSVWLGKVMGRRLHKLQAVANQIAEGERLVRATPDRPDEIGQLAQSVNHMLNTISRSETNLDRLNHVYAAWTECVATIVREDDEIELLNRICSILADKINFRLVLVGFIGEDEWIRIEASNNWQLPYLNDLKLSVDPARSEGHGPLGRAIREKNTQIFNDFLSDPTLAPWHQAARLEEIQSVAALPLSRGGRIIGGIVVYADERDYFTYDVVTLLKGLAADISFALDNFDRERLRQQAEEELVLAASVFENSQEGILITDANQTIIRINSAFSVLTGYSEQDILGKTPRILSSGQQTKAFYQAMWSSINEKGFWQGEIVNRRKNGRIFPEWLSITAVKDKTGRTTHYVGAFIDITERKVNEDRIHKLAFYDPLTQLPNRRLLVERLRQALLDSQRSQQYGALLFMDLDRFKILNDTQGHNMGDQLLVEVGKRIKHCLREPDTVARLGGDEFVVMLEGLHASGDSALVVAKRLCEKILAALDQPYSLIQRNQQGYAALVEHHSSASIGITLFQGTQTSSEELLRQADVAMYQAKRSGRNTFSVFDPVMQANLNQRAELEADMRQALRDEQFQLFFQVQVDRDYKPVGAEGLLRWIHPVRGLIPPTDFIPLAEESGLIVPLGHWVLSEACRTLARWAASTGTEHLVLAINVSAKQLNQTDFVEQLAALIRQTEINPQRLKLEITETAILENVDETIEILHACRRLGVIFSMDDFGTGYSSLSYLQTLPVAQLKIDRSFIRDAKTDTNDAAIIRTILSLGTTLGLDVVAEGVETEEQLAYLLQNGCQVFQGYFFGKPEPLAQFESRFQAEIADPLS